MERFVLIGAGSAMFTRGLIADLIRVGERMEVGLVDIDPDALETAERLAYKMISAREAPIELTAETDRRALLPEATVVICTVGVGGRRAWEQDVFVPREYGIYQPVGDSVGPGGTSRALRMIPAMVDIARDVEELAPRALFFNYGNPMAAVCRAIHKAVEADVTGLCHGVFGTAGYLADCLGVDLASLKYRAVGMNHLTWFLSARVNGRDVWSDLHAIAKERLALATEPDAHLADLSPFSWWLLETYDAFPAPLDRHVTEFFPQFFADGHYYGRRLGVDVYSFEDTIAGGDRIYEEMKGDAHSPEPLSDEYFARMAGEHERVVDIVDSIRTDAGRVYSVNRPNRGFVPNLPEKAIVELPALADAEGLHPLAQAPLPPGVVGTLATRMAWVETTVDAALHGSRQEFVQALVLDGAVSSVEMAKELADELLTVQAPYLPQFGLG